MRDYNVYIISYKRAGMVTSDKVFKNAKIVIPESQYDDYAKHTYHNGAELLPIPDKSDGNIVRKRNWILDNRPGDMVIVDDDYKYIGMVEKTKQLVLTPDDVEHLLCNGFNMCKELKTVMWGLNVQSDPKFYMEYTPLSLTNVVLGPFQAFTEDLPKGIRYDERVYLKEDYDMSLQVLHRYRKILRFDKYHYLVDHFGMAGGVQAYRNMDKEIAHLEALQRKWGSAIVKYNLKKSVNPIIKVPI